MKIKDLKQKHPLIYKRALECQVEQGNVANDGEEIDLSKDSGNFSWNQTKEGLNVWAAVNNGNFQPFYDFHESHKPKETQYPKVMMVSDGGIIWDKRVVFMKKRGRFLAWANAETLEHADRVTEATSWNYAKDIKPKIKLTRQEIASKFEVDLEQIEIVD
jgi:hypothetical protein